MSEKLNNMYKTINLEDFPEKMEIFFTSGGQKTSLLYEKVTWNIGGEIKGLRYGENPCQKAALYKLMNGNLSLGGVETIQSGKYLASEIEILQSGKHPGKINITDVDNALNILRYFMDKPGTVIVKHNNPCGVSLGNSLETSFHKALMADKLAAFGGAAAVNREIDLPTAEIISENYFEVIAAPEYSPKALEILSRRKNLRILRISRIDTLQDFIGKSYLDIKSLIDGGLILQTSYLPKTLKTSDFLPAVAEYKGVEYRINRQPTPEEKRDLLFGWLVESGITSNSVLYVRDETTVGIGTGEQDRVGVAEIARDKAYKKTADRIAFMKKGVLFSQLEEEYQGIILEEVKAIKGGLKGASMVSDGFFPFKDGVEVGLREGITAVIQPGGSERDFESIEACNQYNASMVFTGQRSFKH